MKPTQLHTLYSAHGITITNLTPEQESKEYDASIGIIGKKRIIFRTAKITPTKLGQFVTLWKRNTQTGIIEPLDRSDEFDLVIIHTYEQEHSGLFIFTKAVLEKQKIISSNHQGGKRAIRLYPSWVRPQSPQALKTQKWQLQHFYTIKDTRWKEILL